MFVLTLQTNVFIIILIQTKVCKEGNKNGIFKYAGKMQAI